MSVYVDIAIVPFRRERVGGRSVVHNIVAAVTVAELEGPPV